MAVVKYSIFIYTTGEFKEYTPKENACSEDICLTICKELNICPATRHLFSLRCCTSGVFIPGGRQLKTMNSKYEFRMRFIVPILSKLKIIDPFAYNYFFHQVKTDLISSKIPELAFPHHKEKVLGLCMANMYIEILEKKEPISYFEANFSKFIPKLHIKNQPRTLKSKIIRQLKSFKNMEHDSYYVKGTFLDTIQNLVTNYFVEKYSVDAPYPQEDDLRQGGTCPAEVEISPYNKDRPGLSLYYTSKQLWKHITTLENIIAIIIEEDTVTVEMGGTPNGLVLKMPDNSKLLSLVSCMAGYYRLMVKWTMDICDELKLPSLAQLRGLRCYGPIGGQYSYSKLNRINKVGAHIVRQCETQYDTFYIDILTKVTAVGIQTYKIKRNQESWVLQIKGLHESQNTTSHKTLTEVAKQIMPNLMYTRLSPFDDEYADSPTLLLCRPPDELSSKKIISMDSAAEMRQSTARFFNTATELRKYLTTQILCDMGRITEMRADWLLPGDKKLEVTVRVLNDTKDLSEFLQLNEKWRQFSSTELMKIYGITLSSPFTIVTEYSRFGPLDVFLQKTKNISQYAIVDCANSLARALYFLQEQKVFHGRVRCKSLKVIRYEPPNYILVRLCDPGLAPPYSDADIPWTAPEHRKNPTSIIEDRKAEVYAYTTSVWEMLSRGKPIEKSDYKPNQDTLRKPLECSPELYTNLLLVGWSITPDHRFTFQTIFSTLITERERLHKTYDSITPSMTPCRHTRNTMSDTNSETSDKTEHTYIAEFSDNGGSSQNSEEFLVSPSMYDKDDDCDDPLLNNVVEIKSGQLLFKEKVGFGHYGTVRRGEFQYYNSLDTVHQVAIKTLNGQLESAAVRDFKREIEIMSRLKHKNIVKIFESSLEPQILIIMEFVEHGSFIKYLSFKKDSLTTHKLLNFAKDIADGMKYLVSEKIVHRDLAARNVLIDSSDVVKISDFGLAQATSDGGYYRTTNKDRSVPIKWYAPEYLTTDKYSFQSDVWSFGVTMFEIFSLGESPDVRKGQDLHHTDLLEIYKKGERLQKPATCPLIVYNKLMWPCWKMEPTERPTFAQLYNDITALLNAAE